MKIKKIISLSALVLITGCNSLKVGWTTVEETVNASQTSRVNVVAMDLDVAEQLYQSQKNQQFSEFKKEDFVGTINTGDVIRVRLWESNPAEFIAQSSNPAGVSFPEQTVDHKGNISIPFIGEVQVRGKTLKTVQQEITHRIKNKANKPQVIVEMVKNNGATVVVVRQGVSLKMPLTEQREKVLDAITAVSGSNAKIRDISIRLNRSGVVKTVALDDVLTDDSQNIELNKGDVITLIDKPYSFTALGEVQQNSQIDFMPNKLSLGQALAKIGGFRGSNADPRGVFVFRFIPLEKLSEQERAYWLEQGYTEDMQLPTVYHLSLLDPNSFFVLQRFPIEDKDMVFVSYNLNLNDVFKIIKDGAGLVNPLLQLAVPFIK